MPIIIELFEFETFMEIVNSNATQIAVYMIQLGGTIPTLQIQTINSGFIYEYYARGKDEEPLCDIDLQETELGEGQDRTAYKRKSKKVQEQNADKIMKKMEEYDNILKGTMKTQGKKIRKAK